VSAEDLVAAPTAMDEDELVAALAAEREARAQAESRAAERDARVAKLEADVRDIAKLRDNFHNLYREEREMRAAAEQTAEQRSEEHGHLESEVVHLTAEVERLRRSIARLQAAPSPEASAARSQPDEAVRGMERELGVVISHAADLEVAIAQRSEELAAATQRIEALERELASAPREPGATPTPVASAGDDELAAAQRRIHDLDGALASLQSEHSEMRRARDRVAEQRSALKVQLESEQARRAEAERVAAEAGARATEAVRVEADALRQLQAMREAAERTDLALQAATASIGVLEQRLREAEQAHSAAEARIAQLTEELGFVRSNVLTGHNDAQARGLLRRRGRPATPAGHVETVGTPVDATPVPVSGTPEDVEEILHRRLFGDS
jgi:chromosome segregation ATPase